MVKSHFKGVPVHGLCALNYHSKSRIIFQANINVQVSLQSSFDVSIVSAFPVAF